VLLSKGVSEDKIFFLCIMAAPEGIINLCNRWGGGERLSAPR
jgi:uracil phosphoribosyltransferase